MMKYVVGLLLVWNGALSYMVFRHEEYVTDSAQMIIYLIQMMSILGPIN